MKEEFPEIYSDLFKISITILKNTWMIKLEALKLNNKSSKQRKDNNEKNSMETEPLQTSYLSSSDERNNNQDSPVSAFKPAVQLNPYDIDILENSVSDHDTWAQDSKGSKSASSNTSENEKVSP